MRNLSSRQNVEANKYWRKFIFIAVVLGVVTTIFVSIGFALGSFYRLDWDQWSDNSEQHNWRRYVDPFALPKDADASGSLGWCWANWWATSLSPSLQEKIQRHSSLSKRNWIPNEVSEYQTGWPMPALSDQVHNAYCKSIKNSDPLETDYEHIWASCGILFIRGSAEELDYWEPGVIAIPYVPVWIGFALDSVFYGVIWLILLFMIGLLRRFIRTSRGHCPHCGYNLRGSGMEAGCPECGWNRPENEGNAGIKNNCYHGTLEQRYYYCQNWRADVSAIVNASGKMMEWVKYSSYGIPFGLPAGDTDSDGDCDQSDINNIDNWVSAYDVRYDLDLDGDVDAADSSRASTTFQGTTLGWGVLSSSSVGNRKGYAGYEYDEAVSKYHVRHRVFDPALGRWTRRDPLGYVDGMSLYEYVGSGAIVEKDPNGLAGPRGFTSNSKKKNGTPTLYPLMVRCVKIPELPADHCYIQRGGEKGTLCGVHPEHFNPPLGPWGNLNPECVPWEHSHEQGWAAKCKGDPLGCIRSTPIICPTSEDANKTWNCIIDTMDKLRDAGIGYNPFGPNSNTSLHAALNCCLGNCKLSYDPPRSNGGLGPVGWDSNSLDQLMSSLCPDKK